MVQFQDMHLSFVNMLSSTPQREQQLFRARLWGSSQSQKIKKHNRKFRSCLRLGVWSP
jgi:hypothetical protein